MFPLIGLGFFCGPILVLASSWRKQVPGGPITLAVFALGMGVSMFTAIENLSITEALHFCVVLGTTIGYVHTKYTHHNYFSSARRNRHEFCPDPGLCCGIAYFLLGYNVATAT